MDNELLIWKYIDRQCTAEEEVLFKSRMNDDSFAQQYQSALTLHNILIRETPQAAPSDLIEMTLKRAAQFSLDTTASLSPISYRPLIMFLVVFFSIVLLVMAFSNPMATMPGYNIIPDLFTSSPGYRIELPQLQLPSTLLRQTVYLLLLPVIYILDKLFIRQVAVTT